MTIHDTRVLVVDDNATNRRILDEILRSWGVKPDLAADAHQALGSCTTRTARASPIGWS